mmetsp:Transcript_65690/g.186436  ORF Transcript_65690/g.186436 Transcript_65690/m.186436 type:complete len:242 (+) Transcript_65690:2404-3129(+)
MPTSDPSDSRKPAAALPTSSSKQHIAFCERPAVLECTRTNASNAPCGSTDAPVAASAARSRHSARSAIAASQGRSRAAHSSSSTRASAGTLGAASSSSRASHARGLVASAGPASQGPTVATRTASVSSLCTAGPPGPGSSRPKCPNAASIFLHARNPSTTFARVSAVATRPFPARLCSSAITRCSSFTLAKAIIRPSSPSPFKSLRTWSKMSRRAVTMCCLGTSHAGVAIAPRTSRSEGLK